jgi:hypothetical protein
VLEVKDMGDRAVIDVRERIKNGEHPRGEIINYVKNAPAGTIIEIHVPHHAPPLINGLEELGLNVIVNELDPSHFRLMVVKI